MSTYNHREEEPKWQAKWKEWGIYRFDPSSEAEIFSIDTPPRYTSGALHLGHATSYPAMDFVARYKRMKGYNVFFPLCFDGNGMPVETATEKKYGITKFSVDRETYLKLCEEYANQYIDAMTRQFEMLGMSLDDSIYYETHARYFRRLTQISFLRLLSRGLAYRGTFPVNWCPHCNTSLADAEVEYQELETELHYISFPLREGGGIQIATTRPELIPACQAVLYHPKDKRNAMHKGKHATLPLFEREVPVMADDGVDPSFGTGAVMVCSYGDKEDVAWILKHRLPVRIVLDDFGRLNDSVPFLKGLSTQEARRIVIEHLKSKGYYVKGESIKHSVGVCWRCATPVEILEKKQWFIRSVEAGKKVLESADRIKWYPEFMKQRLRDWTNSLTWDWVVSRQRLFATPVPVWECEKCGYYLPAKEEECFIDPVVTPAGQRCPNDGSELKGSTDVFDTWMDSSITALYNCFWLRDENLFRKMFPMSLRGQAHEIIRTWAYYTILRSALLLNEIPWKEIMITGFIMAPDRKPMHTHLGNVIDPVPLIENYGADALRYYAATCTLGEDQAFRERDVVHGQRLCNKLWNIASFASSAGKGSRRGSLSPLDEWIISAYNETVRRVTASLETYDFSAAMRSVEQFTWHDFADNYIEMVKSRLRKGDGNAAWIVHEICYGVLRLFAPFLPYVTEAAYQQFMRGEVRSIHIAPWPDEIREITARAETGARAVSIVNAVRSWRAANDFRGEIAQLTVFGAEEGLELCREEITSSLRIRELRLEHGASYRRVVSGVRPNFSYIGPRYRERASEIVRKLQSLKPEEIEIDERGHLKMNIGDEKILLEKEAFELQYSYTFREVKGEPLECGDMFLLITK